MIRPAGPRDRDRIEGLLLRQIDGAMFPLSNLRQHGLAEGGFASDAPQACRFWLIGADGLLALTRGGMALPLPGPLPDAMSLRRALSGLDIAGVIGPASVARPLLAALGLAGAAMRLDADEPGFALTLSDLHAPAPAKARLVPLSADHRALATRWRAAAKMETEGLAPDDAARRATADIDRYIAQDSHRLLVLDEEPVAMTGFNAILPEAVQVGGVYTPPALRNRGHARRAVALHLAEARAQGIPRAVLFAVSPAAARAYRAIGFLPGAAFTLALLAQPIRIFP